MAPEYFEVEGTVIGSVGSAKLDDRKLYYATHSKEDACWIGLCQEFPSLSFCAETEDEAIAGIQYVVDKAVEDMQKNGEPVPGPVQEACRDLGEAVAIPVLVAGRKEMDVPGQPGRRYRYRIGAWGKEAREKKDAGIA